MQQTPTEDKWLASLYWFTQHFAMQRHPAQLKTAVALDGGLLTQAEFVRAAELCGLHCEQASLAEIDKLPLPLLAVAKSKHKNTVSETDISENVSASEPLIIEAKHGDKLVVRYAALNAEGQERIAELNISDLQNTLYLLAPEKIVDARSRDLVKNTKRHWLWHAIQQVKPWYRDLLLASLCVNLLALIIPLFTMNVYDRVVPNQAVHTLWVLASGAAIALVFDWLLKQARTKVTDMAGRRIDVNVSSELFSKALGMRLEQRPKSAAAFSKQIQEFDSVRDFLTSATLATLVDLPFTLLFLIVIAWLGGPMVLVPLVIMTGIIIASLLLRGKLQKSIEEASRLSVQRQSQLLEQLQLLPETKQLNVEGLALKRWQQCVAALSDWNISARQQSQTLSHSILSSQQFVTIGLIIVGVYRIGEGLLSMGGLIAIVMLSGRAASSVNQLAMLLLKYQQTRTALDSVNQVMDLEQEAQPTQAMEVRQFEGSIQLEQVDFVYPDCERTALERISFHLARGERVALMGAAGAGKSTLLSLLAYQYRPSRGQLLFDGVDCRQWPVAELREHTAWVAQQPALIYGSLIENICLGQNSVNQDELRKAIVESGVSLFLDQLEKGLDTNVGEFGRALSGGQRQAVVLARALLRQSSLMLLDEPTSAMDQRAEALVIQNLKKLPRSTGMVIASHKPQLLSMCDRAIILDQGRIIADGPVDKLLRQRNRVRSVSVRPASTSPVSTSTKMQADGPIKQAEGKQVEPKQ
ncbi:type I secretion system permease/ATPase [Agaribacterium sp. ZY112]|uniref:type I secretion system permease/ATPase n=1 Tax=Agaribacterium sp. ZY112 TaxID=3233574 RepID=UPI003525C6DD